jgi:two-component system LytT family response regulator
MFKTVIIEDETPAANLLEKMLEELELPIEVVEKCSDLPEGVRAIRKHQPNLVFLDIELPVYSGIQLLDFFNPEEINFNIIFTTAFNEFALKAFEMSAADYLLKPLQHEKLRASLEKLVAKQTMVATPFLPILKENLQTP